MLTEEEIARDREKRARLENIAAAVGLPLDVDNYRVVRALETLDYELSKLASDARPRASQPEQTMNRAAPADMGDRVVEILRARGIIPPVTQQHEQRHAQAQPTDDLGDKVVAELKKRGVGSR